jgi:hypothetical protein
MRLKTLNRAQNRTPRQNGRRGGAGGGRRVGSRAASAEAGEAQASHRAHPCAALRFSDFGAIVIILDHYFAQPRFRPEVVGFLGWALSRAKPHSLQ